MADFLFIAVLALVFVDPRRLPKLARQLGGILAQVQRAKNEFTAQLQHEVASSEHEPSLETATASAAVERLPVAEPMVAAQLQDATS